MDFKKLSTEEIEKKTAAEQIDYLVSKLPEAVLSKEEEQLIIQHEEWDISNT